MTKAVNRAPCTPRAAIRAGFLGAALAWAPAQAAPACGVDEPKAFYSQNCVRCHGEDGSARNPDGTRRPGLDFTQAAITFREMTGPASRRELKVMIRTIRKGILFGRIMPAWKEHLSEEEAALMLQEVLLKAEKGRVIAPGS